MTREEVKSALNSGKKVSHHLFGDAEFVYMKDGRIFDELGCEHTSIFWQIRGGNVWDDGWKIYNGIMHHFLSMQQDMMQGFLSYIDDELSNLEYEIKKEIYSPISFEEAQKYIGRKCKKGLITDKMTKPPYNKSIRRKAVRPKKFKSGNLINTISDVINHPILNIPAYTFVEDDSFVECRRCTIVDFY